MSGNIIVEFQSLNVEDFDNNFPPDMSDPNVARRFLLGVDSIKPTDYSQIVDPNSVTYGTPTQTNVTYGGYVSATYGVGSGDVSVVVSGENQGATFTGGAGPITMALAVTEGGTYLDGGVATPSLGAGAYHGLGAEYHESYDSNGNIVRTIRFGIGEGVTVAGNTLGNNGMLAATGIEITITTLPSDDPIKMYGKPIVDPITGNVTVNLINTRTGAVYKVEYPRVGNGYQTPSKIEPTGQVDHGFTRCFSPSTPILLADGSRVAIEGMRAQMDVMAFDARAGHGRGALVPARVVRIYENVTQEFVKISQAHISKWGVNPDSFSVLAHH